MPSPTRLVVLGLLLSALSSAQSVVTFQDGDMSTWSLVPGFCANGACATADHWPQNGLPGATYVVNHTFVQGLPGVVLTGVNTSSRPDAAFDPVALGGIARVDLAMDLRMYAFCSGLNDTMDFDFVAVQGGVVYRRNVVTTAVGGQGWTHKAESGLLASDFTSASGTHPDFVAGPPIVFGFKELCGGNGGACNIWGGFWKIANVDNFSVVVTTVCTGPAPAVVSLGGACAPSAAVLDVTPPPVPGATTNVVLSSVYPNAHTWVFLSVPPVTAFPIPPTACVAHIDVLNPANLGTLVETFTDANGGVSVALPLPPDPALVGLQVILQARVWAPGGPLNGDHLSNGLLVTVGC